MDPDLLHIAHGFEGCGFEEANEELIEITFHCLVRMEASSGLLVTEPESCSIFLKRQEILDFGLTVCFEFLKCLQNSSFLRPQALA